jgi:hypothetical protein
MYLGHRFQTFIVAFIILLMGVVLEPLSPVLSMACVVILVFYIGCRERKLFVKKVRDRHPDVSDTNELIDDFYIRMDSYVNSYFQGASRHCNTCGTGYYSLDNVLCEEKGIPSHYVMDTPPEDNPYEYWWYQINGYPPPTVTKSKNDFSFDRLHFLKEGVKYYSEHSNTAWDMGVVDPPAWYVDKRIAMMK